jgi:putative restriction endonuclease
VLLRYKYRGTDPTHRDNAGLRQAIQKRIPLIYFHAVFKGRYLAVWPVFIIGDNPSALTFTIAVDDVMFVNKETRTDWDDLRIADSSKEDSRRAYITVSATHVKEISTGGKRMYSIGVSFLFLEFEESRGFLLSTSA